MSASGRLDLYKQHRDEYVARAKPARVEVGPARYLAMPGRGKPGSPEFQAVLQAMYSVAFTIKMTWKLAGKEDYKICHLEGLHWNDPPGWKLLMRTPEFITDRHLDEAKRRLEQKNKPPEHKEVVLEEIDEGTCAQMLHVGPYEKITETVGVIRRFAAENKISINGPLHEIYLSDPRRVQPDRLRTIIRMPVAGP